MLGASFYILADRTMGELNDREEKSFPTSSAYTVVSSVEETSSIVSRYSGSIAVLTGRVFIIFVRGWSFPEALQKPSKGYCANCRRVLRVVVSLALARKADLVFLSKVLVIAKASRTSCSDKSSSKCLRPPLTISSATIVINAASFFQERLE
jgi:hypothetical protein